ncbi:MAG: M23 family metallopeptidase [Candidatus Poribacteria bacterium]
MPDDIRTPGDPRPYRHGVHQGTDFYGVEMGSGVYPVATGLVVRADTEYTRMTPEYRSAILARCREVGATPGELGAGADPKYGDILDKLRGRQVWIYHGDTGTGLPVLSVYAHLSDVASVNLGEYVSSDRQIGAVGNSGTSDEGDDGGAHLHLEVYVGDEYWTPREPRERGYVQAAARRRELRETTLSAFGWPSGDD